MFVESERGRDSCDEPEMMVFVGKLDEMVSDELLGLQKDSSENLENGEVESPISFFDARNRIRNPSLGGRAGCEPRTVCVCV